MIYTKELREVVDLIMHGTGQEPEQGDYYTAERIIKLIRYKDATPRPLQDAIDELEKHDELKIIDKLHDCQQPKWERLLRDLVKQYTDSEKSDE